MEDYLKSLKLNSVTDFRVYIVNKLLELSESDKPDHKITALKELSKLIFFPETLFSKQPVESIFDK
ncbi:MAG: hypothetical protein ABI840_04200 [bacterium]